MPLYQLSKGLYQPMPPMDWDTIYDEIKESLKNMTKEERFEAARQYMLKVYGESIR